VADVPQGYRDIPEEDRRKANVFFDRGKQVADTGQYEYAIDMYLSGLKIDPENVDAHNALREISLKRKVSGGKAMGMMQAREYKTNTSDDKANLLNAEKLLAFDPGNTDRMVTMLQSAHRAGFYDTVLWVGQILMKANSESKKPEFNKYIILKDVYKDIGRYTEAVQACHYAMQIKPHDMDLATEAKNLAANKTMMDGNYLSGRSFRDSIKDMEGQKKLLDSDKDIRTADSLMQAAMDAEEEYNADPNEPGKLTKLVEALVRTERPDQEAKATALLDEAFARTKQFRWRQMRGKILIGQLSRQERDMRQQLQKDPGNVDLKADYQTFLEKRVRTELEELTLWAENYPTDSNIRYELAKRLFQTGRFDEAIPVFQHVRNDPKLKIDATIYLGRAFYEAQFLDEAADTLRSVIEEYPIKGDDKSKAVYYAYGLTLEALQRNAEAVKAYSQVAMWDFNYKDVQTRIKRLRAAATAPTPPSPT
jgi:tetratricopeptide (TPR) repeat protein